jgi:hypothetical protein
MGCGDQSNASEQDVWHTNGAQEFDAVSESRAMPENPGDEALGEAHTDCSDGCAAQTDCGQICLSMKGVGSSCQLLPTVNDLTRPPRSVRFDCSPLQRGPNGYDFDALGHIVLTGRTCEALHTGGPHHVELILTCPP